MHEEFIKHTDSFERRIGRVVEELHEVGQAFGKSYRFGWLSVDPTIPEEERQTNFQWFLAECHDLKHAITKLEEALDEHTDEIAKIQASNLVEFWSEVSRIVGLVPR